MSLHNILKNLREPKYFLIFLITTVLIGWLYIGPLTNQDAYDAIGWMFAILFPIFVGLIVSLQIYNISERKTCPTSATSGGILGVVVGIITVGCPACPLILLSWFGCRGNWWISWRALAKIGKFDCSAYIGLLGF